MGGNGRKNLGGRNIERRKEGTRMNWWTGGRERERGDEFAWEGMGVRFCVGVR